MSDQPPPDSTPAGPTRRRAVLLAALAGSAALHAALVFGPDLGTPEPEENAVAAVPVHQIPPELVAPPEPVPESKPAAEPQPEPHLKPTTPPPPPATPEPEPVATSEPPASSPPTPALPAATPPTPMPAVTDTSHPTADASSLATDDTTSGSFAGRANGNHGPSLRINWGTPADARARLQRGGLQLAVFNTAGGAGGRKTVITHAVYLNPDGTARRDTPPALTRFDSEARIVGDAPAFAHAARSLGLNPHEYLVILLPRALADQARLAQRTFVRRQGHRWEDVAITTAVLDPVSNGLRARVTGLHPVRSLRAQPPTHNPDL